MKDKINRAAQFMPFDALKGFRTKLKIKEKELLKQEEKDVVESDINRLQNIINLIKKGSNVVVVYYEIDDYTTLTSIVKYIDFVLKRIILEDRIINFNDILDIKIL